MSVVDLNDTIVAQATPVGEGAIGIIRLSGPRSKEILSKIFRDRKAAGPPAKWFESHRLYAGKIVHPDSAQAVDEVMAVWMKRPNSFTGEEMVEIQGHGGPIVLKQLIGLTVELGARLAEPGEFSKRAFLNGKIDLSQAEAVADLIAAQSEWGAKNALSQLNGTLSEIVRRLRGRIIEIMAQIEAGFDFVEEDVQTFKQEDGLRLLGEMKEEIGRLLDSFQTGRLYKEGLRVVLVGKPNVGKSSLLNALLNEEKAIVHEQPGTTRDILEGERMIHGIRAIFHDTAGIREAENSVEEEGIRRSNEILKKADLVLLLLDSSRELSPEDQQLLEQINLRRCIIIYSKSDLPPSWDPTSQIVGTLPIIRLSAKNRTGIEALMEKIYDVSLKNKLIKDHNYVLNNVRHYKGLGKIHLKLEELTLGIGKGLMKEECLVEELRIIADDLSGITGEITSETVLDEVFSRFCIGK
ncbi:MAG: tRNA uridine-5-carboxymethylaminomethyl(34) synthesis GTPase MnmE [Deltaproteobacteria bacterium]|nr:tRNA uridine-5-carboxymethylaminomethyl(34) synthesis GTPase MnmE [Deltaproteobacteria bacterium]